MTEIWEVWYIESFHQWVVHATDFHPLFYRRQRDAWHVAKVNARKRRSIAYLYYKTGTARIRVKVDYRGPHEKVQAT